MTTTAGAAALAALVSCAATGTPPGEEPGWPWRLLGGVAEAAAGAPDAAIILRWTPVPGIERYRLQIAEDERFSRVVVDVKVDAPFYEWRKIAKRDFFWRVQSIDAEGRPGEFSAPRMIGAVLSAPPLLSPEPGAELKTAATMPAVLLRWTKMPLARLYEVEVAGRILPAKEPSLVYVPAAPGDHAWKVRAIDAAGGKTPFGEERTFRVLLGVPVLAPVAGGADRVFATDASPIVLRWSEVALATEYEVEVAAGKKSGPVAASGRADARSFPFTPPSTGAFTWRVRAHGAAPATSDWSKGSALVVRPGVPVVRLPAPGAVIGFRGSPPSVEVRWDEVPGASGYEVVVRAASAPPEVEPVARVGSATPFVTVPGVPVGKFVVLVRVLGLGGVDAESAEQRLEVAELPPLAAPAMRAPTADLPFRGAPPPLALSWDRVESAAGYEVNVRVPAAKYDRTERTTAPAASLHDVPAGDLNWRVRAVDATGAAGAWSAPAALWFGPPRTAMVRLEAPVVITGGRDRAFVTVRLSDAAGGPVVGARLTAEVDAGRVVEPPHEKTPGVYVLRYEAPRKLPAARAAILVVRDLDAGFRAEGRIPLRSPEGAVSFGPAVGLVANLGPVLAPSAALVGVWHTPLLRRRLEVGARLDWHVARRAVDDELGLRATMHAFALELGPRVALTLGSRLFLYAGGAVALGAFHGTIAGPTQETLARWRFGPGAAGLVGLEMRLRSGVAFLELRVRWLRASSELFEFDGGGLGADLGWRFRP